MSTLLDHKTTMAYLAYLGFPDADRTKALRVTRPRRQERRKAKTGKGDKGARTVFLAWVCGAAGSGKTTLLRNLVRKPYKDAYMPTSKPINVVNSVEIDGSEKYLVVSVTRIASYLETFFASSKMADQHPIP
jgi:Ras family protein T1